MDIIYTNQINLIRKCKLFLNKNIKNKIEVDISPLCFFTTWTNSLGKNVLCDLLKISNIKNFYVKIKNILSIGYHYDLNVYGELEVQKKKSMNLIVSYCDIKSFDKNGNFFDNYFRIGSNKLKNTIWFLISLDHKLPEKFKKNILIFKKKKFRGYSLLFFFKVFITNILKFKFSFNKLDNYNCGDYVFSERINKFLFEKINNYKIKNLLLNYEGIPFQNLLIKNMRKIQRKTKIYGYLHCAPWPLQTDLIFKKQSLDKLYVSGQDQKDVLVKYFLWNKKKINVIPSLRFRKTRKKQFSGQIFVPYDLDNNNHYEEKFDKFLLNLPDKSINHLMPRIHPLKRNSKDHLRFSKKLEKIIKIRKKNLIIKKNLYQFLLDLLPV